MQQCYSVRAVFITKVTEETLTDTPLSLCCDLFNETKYAISARECSEI